MLEQKDGASVKGHIEQGLELVVDRSLSDGKIWKKSEAGKDS